MKNNRKWWKILLKVALWFVGIWAALLVILQLTLSEQVLTKLVNKYAAEYIDGDISFGRASVSMFKKFPRVLLTLDDVSITYPADRFDEQEKLGAQGFLMYSGCGETADTLASFEQFSASLNVLSLIGGRVSIPHLSLIKPRIFAHSYANGDTNWDIFITDSEETEEEDSTDSYLPGVTLKKISLINHPHIVYTDSRDTIFTMIDVARIEFDGKIKTDAEYLSDNEVNLKIDSMFVAGRVYTDTLALAVDRFHMHEDDDVMDVEAEGKAMMASSYFGRVHLPITLTGEVSFPEDTVAAVAFRNFHANIADVPFMADFDLRLLDDRTGIRANIQMQECKLNDVLHGFAKNLIPELEKVQTDAEVTMIAECDGDYIYDTEELPPFKAEFTLPEAGFTYDDLEGMTLMIEMGVTCLTDTEGRINTSLDKIKINTAGLHADMRGGAKDLMGDDPALDIDAKFSASLDTLITYLPDTLGITASGSVAAYLKGEALLSQLSVYNFSRADIVGNISSDIMMFQMPSDTIDVRLDGLDITLAPEERVSRRDPSRKFRLMGVTATVNNANIQYGEMLTAVAQDFIISAKNSINTENAEDTTSRINPLSGRLKARLLTVKDAESTNIMLNETDNSFRVFPKRGQPQIPVLTLSSTNRQIRLASGSNRANFINASFKTTAAMNTVERNLKAKAYKDSLARRYPDVPIDSLFAHQRRQRGNRPMPEWLKEEDFRKQDIDIRLDETMAQYFRDWDIEGNIAVKNGVIFTPYFPLRNFLRGFNLDFTNNEIKVDQFKIASGNSEMEAKGSLTGLKGALLGRGPGALKFNLDITSEKMDADELFIAYQKGYNYVPEDMDTEEISDEELMEMMAISDSTSIADSTISSLIVVPANLVADIRLNASNIKYSDLVAEKVTAKLIMKERCVQITDTWAKTNMGDITFDAFYSTRSKQDIKAGFDLNFKDITAEKVINLMPAIDTLMPLLKSFSGLLNCEIAATSSLDTNMNLVMPSINGIIRISGDDLTISGSDMYRSLAKKLMFKNKNEGHIDNMTVEGIIQDNTLEVFPFIIKMDRYMLALSGVQNLDMSYKYHASLIKSPFLIKLGVDVYGQDFDDMRIRVGKAKYKNGNVPVFSTIIDQTKVNLVESIYNIFDKGVDAAMRENFMLSALTEHKQKIGYVRAVDMQMEELSADEQKQMEAEEAAEEQAEAEAETKEESTENK